MNHGASVMAEGGLDGLSGPANGLRDQLAASLALPAPESAGLADTLHRALAAGGLAVAAPAAERSAWMPDAPPTEAPPGPDDHRLTFHVFASPAGINWSSPRALFLSAVLNRLHPRDRKLSHIAVELRGPRCRYGSGAGHHSFSSMSDRGRGTVRKLLVEQIGLGMMLANYPGALETAPALLRETRRKERSGRVRRVTYLISEATAFRLQRYFREYSELGNDRIYGGLASDPRHLEGAGCVAYARAVAEVAGLGEDGSQAGWRRTIRIPAELVGDPGANRRVPVARLVWGRRAGRWAGEDEPHFPITFFDPDLIFRQVGTVARALSGRGRLPAELAHFARMSDLVVRQHHRAYELVFDRRELATPTDDLWRPRRPAPRPQARVGRGNLV